MSYALKTADRDLTLMLWASFLLFISYPESVILGGLASLVLAVLVVLSFVSRNHDTFFFGFVPIFLLSSSSYSFHSGQNFAVGFFTHVSLDLYLMVCCHVAYIVSVINRRTYVKNMDALIISFLAICIFSSLRGYFGGNPLFTYPLYFGAIFVVFRLFDLYLADISATKRNIYLKMNLSLLLIFSLFVFDDLTKSFFVLIIASLMYVLTLRLNFISYIDLFILILIGLFFFEHVIGKENLTIYFLYLSLFFCFCLTNSNIISLVLFFYTLSVLVVCSVVLLKINLDLSFLNNSLVGQFISDRFPYLWYKLLDDRAAIWFGALNQLTAQASGGVFFRSAGELFYPLESRVFHSEFFVDRGAWTGLSHSSFIEVAYQLGIIGMVVFGVLMFMILNSSFIPRKSSAFGLFALLVLLTVSTYPLEKSFIGIAVFLPFFLTQRVHHERY